MLALLAYIVLIGSVKFVSKDKNCFPFLLKPLTIASEETKILSAPGPKITTFHSGNIAGMQINLTCLKSGNLRAW